MVIYNAKPLVSLFFFLFSSQIRLRNIYIVSSVSSLSSFMKKRHGTSSRIPLLSTACQILSFLAGVSSSISNSRTTINHYPFCRRASSERTMVISIQTPPVRAENIFGLKGEVKENSQKCNPGIQSSR